MNSMGDGDKDWHLQVVEERTESNSRSLFLSYVRDSINHINNHQIRQVDNTLAQMQSDVTDGPVAGNGNQLLSSNGTIFDDYQHYGETIYGNYNGSEGGDGDEFLENFSSPYLMPWPQRTAWIAVFTLMLLVATVGNALVAWIVLGQLYVYSYILTAILSSLPLCAINWRSIAAIRSI